MKELLVSLASGLVENPEAVEVTVDEPNEAGVTVYHLHVGAGALPLAHKSGGIRLSQSQLFLFDQTVLVLVIPLKQFVANHKLIHHVLVGQHTPGGFQAEGAGHVRYAGMVLEPLVDVIDKVLFGHTVAYNHFLIGDNLLFAATGAEGIVGADLAAAMNTIHNHYTSQ